MKNSQSLCTLNNKITKYKINNIQLFGELIYNAICHMFNIVYILFYNGIYHIKYQRNSICVMIKYKN